MERKQIDFGLVALMSVSAFATLLLALALAPLFMQLITACVSAIRDEWPRLVDAFK